MPPLFAGIGDLDPTFAGGAGSKAFDLGKSFKICAMDVASDGTTVLTVNTTDGSEIWKVDAAGTAATHLKTYSFPGTTNCDEGLRALTCPDGTYTCVAAGNLRQGGEAATWAVAFDRRNGNPDSSILQGGSEVVDLDPTADDGANAVGVDPASGITQDVLPAGSDGDFGMNLDLGPTGGWTLDTLMIAHQPTVLRGQRFDGGERYSWGDTKPGKGQSRYIWVCADKKDANGNWVPDETFAKNGCLKLESDELVSGVMVDPSTGFPFLLTEVFGGPYNHLGLRSLGDYAGTSQMRIEFDAWADTTGDALGAQLTCCVQEDGQDKVAVEWLDDKGAHAQNVSFSEGENKAGDPIAYLKLQGVVDIPQVQESGNGPGGDGSDLSSQFFVDSALSENFSKAPASPILVGGGGPSSKVEPAAPSSTSLLVFVYRDGPTAASNLVIARVQMSYPPGPCVAGAHTLCIDDQPGDKRYRVTVDYATTQGGRDGSPQHGNAIGLGSLGVTHGGLFWFFDAKNPEMLIKVLNGTNANQHRWVFYSAGTNVGLTTTVQDTQTGAVVTYDNPDRHPAAPVLDTAAFTADGQVGNPYQQTDKSFDYAQDFTQAPEAATTCATTDTSLCIDNRFQITVSYHTTQGGRDGSEQVGHAISLSSLNVDRGGLFWFFDKSNPEMLIKVLDACGLSGHYWVFYSAGTSVGLTTTVVDTMNHLANTYTNDDKSPAPGLLDQQAFPCP